MESNPYTPTQAPLIDSSPPTGPVKAVLTGLTIDIGGSFVSGVLLMTAYVFALASTGMKPEEIAANLAGMDPTSWVSIAGYVIGCGLSILGAYVCARMARRTDYRLGIVQGSLSVCIGFLLSYGRYSLPANFGLAVLGFTCVMVGTRLGMVRAR